MMEFVYMEDNIADVVGIIQLEDGAYNMQEWCISMIARR